MSSYENTLHTINTGCLSAALRLLPARMDSINARGQLLKTTLQEARGTMRKQSGGGPARGLWQFELGSEKTRGGVYGVFLHSLTRHHLQGLCRDLKVAFTPEAIHAALETNDVLAAGLARLNYWWVSAPIPSVQDEPGSWDYYNRTWRPGHPREETWHEFHCAVLHYLITQ